MGNRTPDLRITSVSRCVATGVGTPPTLRFAGCSCWRLLVVHGPSGARLCYLCHTAGARGCQLAARRFAGPAGGGVRAGPPVSATAQVLGCTIGCTEGGACPCGPAPVRPSRSCPPLAVAAVSGLAKRPRSGLALTQRTRPRSSCSEEDEPQLGRLRLLPARPAVTQVMVLSLVMSDRECPCLTDRSGTQRARAR